MAKNKDMRKNVKKEKGTNKKSTHEKTQYQRDRDLAKDRKRKNGNYGIGL